MRKTLLFFMLLSVKLTFGQVLDGFSDGDLLLKPAWLGDQNRFYVNSQNRLQTLPYADNQVVILSTASSLLASASWEFFVELSFDPSTNNQARIYLVSDEQNLNGPLNGYFIQIGESGSLDSYDLYRQTGLVVTKIIDGVDKFRSNVNKLTARIRATRDEVGNWSLYADATGGNQFILEGKAKDVTHLYTDWFGISCRYTATRADGFVFDDFKVERLEADVNPPILLSAKSLDAMTVEATFSERLEPISAGSTSNYTIDVLGHPVSAELQKLPNKVKLTYSTALPTGNHQLKVNQLVDLSGNMILQDNSASFFYLPPYQLQQGDLLISEVLVNPQSGGVDFIEIYNASERLIDLKGLQLANLAANGSIANVKNVTDVAIYMPAKSYWVFTTNPDDIKQRYDVRYPEQMVKLPSLPAYNNDKGQVVLLTQHAVLESFNYDENMHNPLLQQVDGVSLERVSFAKGANEKGNFASAAMSAGFATPTTRNSQLESETQPKNYVSIPNRTFSPDGDGFEDLLTINYQFSKGVQLATINIYTDRGLLVKRLQRNTSIGLEGVFVWDGLDDRGAKSKLGIYIVSFDAFSPDGHVAKFRKACVLAAKLN